MTQQTEVGARQVRMPALNTTFPTGPAALIGAGVIALAVTLSAATFVPALAQHGHSAYSASGAAMSAADLLVLIGMAVLSRSEAVRQGWLKRIGFILALSGSAGVVVAEGILRANFDLGNAVFGIVGPMQAIGFILVGIGIILTSAWSGWRRFVLLLLGLYVPAVLVPALALSKGENLPALAGYHTLILLVGIAYWQESRRRRA
jgi:hypothetical protein